MFDSSFAWLLLPTCGVLGWSLGRRWRRPGEQIAVSTGVSGPMGLSGSIGDDSDDAIGALSRAIEAEPGAVELQLTLGGLFRRRGEIDRAIRLHESLLERHGLSDDITTRARLALSRDFLKAGVIDRAQTLAESLLDSPTYAVEALELLLDLYEQSRDWPAAVATALRLQSVSGRSSAARIAQYHCEIAEAARHAGDRIARRKQAREALAADRDCVRASLLLGALDEAEHPEAALKHFRRVFEQDLSFAAEALEPTRRCCAATETLAEYDEVLLDAEAQAPKSTPIILARARRLAETGGDANGYLAGKLAERPSLDGFILLLELGGLDRPASEDEPAAPTTSGRQLAAALRKVSAQRPRYRCTNCGFQPGMLFWQCPNCKQWAAVKPADVTLA